MSRRENILWIVRKLPPSTDGVGDYTWRLAAELSAKGHRVSILTSSDQCPKNGEMTVLPWIERWSFREAAKVVAACREHDATVVSLQFSPFMYGRRGACLYLAWWLWRVRLATNARVVVTFHELYNSWSWHPWRAAAALLQRLQFLLIGIAANELVFTAQKRVKRGKRWFPWKREHVHQLPVGSNIQPVETAAAEIAGPFRISTFGMLQQGVAFESLLTAFSGLVHDDELDAELLILGDWSKAEPKRKRTLDELVDSLKLRGRVRWSGPQPPDEISRLLASSAVYVLYRADGPTTRSGTLAAALAHGLPVLASASGQMDPAFANDRVAILFRDADELREKCRRVLMHAPLRAQMSRNAREFYNAHLTWGRIAERYETLCHPKTRSGRTGRHRWFGSTKKV